MSRCPIVAVACHCLIWRREHGQPDQCCNRFRGNWYVDSPARQHVNIKTLALSSWLKSSANSAMPALFRLPLLILVSRSSKLIISVSWSDSQDEVPAQVVQCLVQAFRGRKWRRNQKTDNEKPSVADITDAELTNDLNKAGTPFYVVMAVKQGIRHSSLKTMACGPLICGSASR